MVLAAGTAAAEENMSSAQLVQFAVDIMGDSSQDALVSGFDTAESRQIGYSSDGSVTQTVSYDNIRNGSIIQWGESGDMPYEERTLNLDSIGDSGFIWQWNKGDVNQTINIRNSENLYLKQIVGGLKKILFPDPKANQEDQMGTWTFCGKATDGKGGLPLCAEKIAKRIFNGSATDRDYYMLDYLESEYNVFPPENLTPHITLTKWNITRVNDSLKIKFYAHNFGKQTYNATLMLDLTPRINIPDIDGSVERINTEGVQFKLMEENFNSEIKIPEKQSIEIGSYTVPRMRGFEGEVEVPLNGMKIKGLEMRMISD